MKNDSRYPLFLLCLYLIEFFLLGYAPASRVTWIAENTVAVLPVAGLVWLYWKGIRFSNLAYTLAAIFIFCHTILLSACFFHLIIFCYGCLYLTCKKVSQYC